MKILFVCLGNICRSPLAEGIMLSLNAKLQLGWTIDSAGTSNYHIGEAPDSRSISNAAKHGVNLSTLRARQFKQEDFAKFDYVLAMDKNNLNNVLQLAATDAEKKKAFLFLEFVNHKTLKEVPDPYYGSSEDFEQVFQLVYEACLSLVNQLQQRK